MSNLLQLAYRYQVERELYWYYWTTVYEYHHIFTYVTRKRAKPTHFSTLGAIAGQYERQYFGLDIHSYRFWSCRVSGHCVLKVIL
jgi:hypothetical protein